jgi:hypothetical protein
MAEGFIKDHTRNSVDTSKWVDGPPEKSFWHGLKTRGKRQIPMTTYRCSRCGYLESYAVEKPAADR